MTRTRLQRTFVAVFAVALLLTTLPAAGAERPWAQRIQVSEFGMLSLLAVEIQQWLGRLLLHKEGPSIDPWGNPSQGQSSGASGEPGESGPHIDPNGQP